MTMLDDPPVDDLDRSSPWSNAAMSSAAEIGRWRLSARLARREIRRRPWRTLLVVLLVGVPVAGMVVADAGYRSSQLTDDPSHRFGTAAARLMASGGDEVPQQIQATLPPGSTSLWGQEVSFLPLRSVERPDVVVTVDLSTLDMADPMAAGIARPTHGRLPTANDEVFLTERVAAQFGVGVGDTLQLVRPAQSFQVVGIGTAGSDGLMAAPGFDLDALRPDIAQHLALVDGPSARAGSLASWNVEYPPMPQTDHLALFLGWVFCIMLMAVLGIIVAAAFAVSGRRQLVTIGQLSAAGTDPAVLRRYLGLQGTWSGAVGVVVGMATGLGLVPLLDGVVANDGRTVLGTVDLIAIALVALATATIAAVVPTRDLARASVLSALGGRRPVASVRPRQVRVGAVLVAGGLTALWVAVSSARQSTNNGDGAAVVLAGGGGLAVLAGMCCVCPVVVDLVSRVGARRRGATRLATRGLGRHRARSAALMAAIAAIGAAAMAAGATAEQEFASRSANRGSALDLIEVRSTVVSADAVDAERSVTVGQSVIDDVEAVVGPVEWYRAQQVRPNGDDSVQLLVADEGLLDLLGLTQAQRAELAQVDAADIEPTMFGAQLSDADLAQVFGSLKTIAIEGGVDTDRSWQIITPQAVERLGLELMPASTFGRLDHDVTRDEYDALTNQNVFTNETAYFRDVAPGELLTSISVGFPEYDYSTVTRLIILGGMLLLTTVVVGVGMALWAAEGKDERDALVSIGAPPAVLARVVGIKAWLLAVVGGIIAVPLGYGTVRLAVAAAGQHTRFPWWVAGGVVVVVPVVIGLVATVGSAIAQRVRPVRMSTLATD